jgi:hypothetical protein
VKGDKSNTFRIKYTNNADAIELIYQSVQSLNNIFDKIYNRSQRCQAAVYEE